MDTESGYTTKIYEEIFRGTVGEAIRHFSAPKGEFTLVVAGKPKGTPADLDSATEKRLKKLHRSGITAKQAIASLAGDTGLPRKKLYQAWLKNK